MNVYFACSITGGREFEPVYQAIVRALTEDQHVVPTAHLAESGIMALEAVIDPGEVYVRDVAWIRGCDILIAEVSLPSHGVGKTSAGVAPGEAESLKNDQRKP